MNLDFPPLSGGTVSGLNDAGIETFEHPLISKITANNCMVMRG